MCMLKLIHIRLSLELSCSLYCIYTIARLSPECFQIIAENINQQAPSSLDNLSCHWFYIAKLTIPACVVTILILCIPLSSQMLKFMVHAFINQLCSIIILLYRAYYNIIQQQLKDTL